MVTSLILFLPFIQLVFADSLVQCDQQENGLKIGWQKKTAMKSDDSKEIFFFTTNGQSIFITKQTDGVTKASKYTFIKNIHNGGFWRLEDGSKRSLYCDDMENEINKALSDDSAIAIKIATHMIKGRIISEEQKVSIREESGGIRLKFKDIDGKSQSIRYSFGIPDERVVIDTTNYRFTKTSSGIRWKIPRKKGSDTTIEEKEIKTDTLRKKINNALKNKIPMEIQIGPYKVQEVKPPSKSKSRKHIKRSHTIPEAPRELETIERHGAIPEISITEDLHRATFKFVDFHGQHQTVKFDIYDKDPSDQTVHIGKKTYTFNQPAGQPVRWESETGNIQTNALEGEIIGKLGGPITIKIGKYTLQQHDEIVHATSPRSSGASKPIEITENADGVTFKFIDVDKEHQTVTFNGGPDEFVYIDGTTYKFSKPPKGKIKWQYGSAAGESGAIDHDTFLRKIDENVGQQTKIDIGEYIVQHGAIRTRGMATPADITTKTEATTESKRKPRLVLFAGEMHPSNKEIATYPNPEITEIIEKSFKGKINIAENAYIMRIYDFAVKDTTVHQESQYLEFISRMDKLTNDYGKLTTGERATHTEERATQMMAIYGKYMEPAGKKPTVEIHSRIQSALTKAAKGKFKTETNPDGGAWADAKNEAYEYMQRYFNRCVPLLRPHDKNPRVQSTPTTYLVAKIKSRCEGTISGNWIPSQSQVQNIYDNLVDYCAKEFNCENYEFISAVEYLKEVCKKDGKCDIDMMHVYKAYVIEGAKVEINLKSGSRRVLTTAAKDHFATKETNPDAGGWLAAKNEVDQMIVYDMFGRVESSTSIFKKPPGVFKKIGTAIAKKMQKKTKKGKKARKSDYNELINYDDEYYDGEYYDGEYYNYELGANEDESEGVSFDSGYNNIYNAYDDNEYYELGANEEESEGVSFDSGSNDMYNAYDDGYYNDYNHRNGNAIGSSMNLILMFLIIIIGLLFGLNVISCGCCYVFGRYQSKIVGNKYEYDFGNISNA